MKNGPPFPLVIIGLALVPFVIALLLAFVVVPLVELWLRYG